VAPEQLVKIGAVAARHPGRRGDVAAGAAQDLGQEGLLEEIAGLSQRGQRRSLVAEVLEQRIEVLEVDHSLYRCSVTPGVARSTWRNR